MVAREGFIYKQNAQSVTRNVVMNVHKYISYYFDSFLYKNSFHLAYISQCYASRYFAIRTETELLLSSIEIDFSVNLPIMIGNMKDYLAAYRLDMNRLVIIISK